MILDVPFAMAMCIIEGILCGKKKTVNRLSLQSQAGIPEKWLDQPDLQLYS